MYADVHRGVGDFLEVSTAPPAGNTFDFQVNSGSTLNGSDPDQPYTTNFALFFGQRTWTIGVFEPVDPLADFNLELTDTNHFTTRRELRHPAPSRAAALCGRSRLTRHVRTAQEAEGFGYRGLIGSPELKVWRSRRRAAFQM